MAGSGKVGDEVTRLILRVKRPASEIVKAQVNSGRRRELYFFRDEQGLEVDSLVLGRGGSVSLVECKTGRTVTPAMAAPLQRLAEALKKQRPGRTAVAPCLVHQTTRKLNDGLAFQRDALPAENGQTNGPGAARCHALMTRERFQASTYVSREAIPKSRSSR